MCLVAAADCLLAAATEPEGQAPQGQETPHRAEHNERFSPVVRAPFGTQVQIGTQGQQGRPNDQRSGQQGKRKPAAALRLVHERLPVANELGPNPADQRGDIHHSLVIGA